MKITQNALDIALSDLMRKSKNSEYKWNPVLWAEEVLGATLWSKQKEMMMSVAQNKRTGVKSCHSSGKSYTMGVLACWWVCTRGFNSLVVSTAPTYAQVHSILWAEVRKHWAESDLPGDVTQGDVWNLTERRSDGKLRRDMVGFGRRPADYDTAAFQGLHRTGGVLFLLDEAVGVPEELFTAAEVNTTGPHDRIFAIANPDDPNTAFGRIFMKADGTWNLMTISAFDTPNFTGEDIPEEMSHHFPQVQWVEDMGVQWGLESARYKAKILAEFPIDGDTMFFPQAVIDQATDYDPADPDIYRDESDTDVIIGVDIARFGDDESQAYIRDGKLVKWLDAWKLDMVETAGKIRSLAINNGATQVRIDGAGLGAGVVDFLMHDPEFPHDRCMVIAMQGSAVAADKFSHANARAERHDELRKAIIRGQVKIDPYDTKLIDEMKSTRFTFDNRGAILMESKRDIRKRGAKSPDRLDAVTYAISNIDWLLNPEVDKATLTVDASEYTKGGYGNPLFDALEW